MKGVIKPFSKNVVFFDTEFSSNDHSNAELLSLGLVKLNGDDLYLEFSYKNPISDWVKENVLPYLKQKKISNTVAINKIKKFIGNDKPYLITFIYPFDYLLLEKLFGWDEMQKVFQWPPIDFASILFGINIDPVTYYTKNKNNFFKKIGVDASKYKTHNALDDAKLLREVYLKMTNV